MFWKKKKITEESSPEEVIQEVDEIDEIHELTKAVATEREYIDIQKESLPIDVVEMCHFFNELPSMIPVSLLKKNEEAIDYFRTFTGTYVGTPFEFYQTVVLFYYKNWHNPEFPFEGSQLEFVFSKVAQNISEQIVAGVENSYQEIEQLVIENPKAFYFHEDQIEIHANRFMRRLITMIPQFEYSDYYTPIESEFVILGNEIYRDVLDLFYDLEHRDFSEFDRIYRLLEQNETLMSTPDLMPVKALFYYPIKHVEIIRVLQYIRIQRLQEVILQALQYDLSTQIESIKTVRVLEQYLLNENERLYSQSKEVHLQNQRVLSLFFASYYFEKGIDDAFDSPKVRNCLNELVERKKVMAQDLEFVKELEILIKRAYYEHQLLAGN
ncbi:hypothetical protein [Kurthia zopfii]|uniref:hypothetical protein n=1 Tax=Kurthia zopfii TaxID=1650 RepID=UPI000F6CB74F|nr:hypothetical protein [Kurthia zopfii]VEI07457.1 Uncharacterised protein [Kurthia zopfii]